MCSSGFFPPLPLHSFIKMKLELAYSSLEWSPLWASQRFGPSIPVSLHSAGKLVSLYDIAAWHRLPSTSSPCLHLVLSSTTWLTAFSFSPQPPSPHFILPHCLPLNSSVLIHVCTVSHHLEQRLYIYSISLCLFSAPSPPPPQPPPHTAFSFLNLFWSPFLCLLSHHKRGTNAFPADKNSLLLTAYLSRQHQ